MAPGAGDGGCGSFCWPRGRTSDSFCNVNALFLIRGRPRKEIHCMLSLDLVYELHHYDLNLTAVP